MSSLENNVLTWKTEYNIGNFKIDNEHQQLFSIAKKAMNVMNKEGNGIEELKEIIKKLFQYVAIHFKNEEAHMKSIKFPDFEAHKHLHKNMIQMLSKLVEELNSLEENEIKTRVFKFIDEYFIKHIILEDKKIKIHETPLEELRESFGWKEIYKLDHETVDSEHKQLFIIASKAFQVVDNGKRNEKIKSVLVELYDYMKKHFEHEEQLMESIGFDKIEEHKKLHHDIIQALNTFVKKLPSMDPSFFEKELAKIIDTILVQHIVQEDKKIMVWEMSKK